MDPLTGVAVRAVARNPIVVVKIDNASVARPQAGLNNAGIVVEELVEGGITRFATMFHSYVPRTVGPVRSLRDVDREIAGPTIGLIVASGGARGVLRRVRAGRAQVIVPTNAGGAYFRSGGRPAPHNLYLAPRQILHLARGRHRRPPTIPYLPFAATVAQSTAARYGHPVRRIDLSFSPASNPGWTYDRRSGDWLRSESGSPSRDSSGRRLSARTVLVLDVRTVNAGYHDPAGNYVPRTVFTGHGKAMVFCRGRRISAVWFKRSAGTPLRLYTRFGHKPLLIAPGRTWIEMLPSGGSMRAS